LKAADVPEGPLLIDTDVFSWITWSRGRYMDFERLIVGHILLLSFATVGELRGGAFSIGWGAQKMARPESAIRTHYVVLPGTDRVATEFGRIHARFRDQLKGGGTNDMWIAACALAQPHVPSIVTWNIDDFATIASEFPLTIVHPDV
jgi:predicted nucleic acid-binding protein